jgi:hypothetical protein
MKAQIGVAVVTVAFLSTCGPSACPEPACPAHENAFRRLGAMR